MKTRYYFRKNDPSQFSFIHRGALSCILLVIYWGIYLVNMTEIDFGFGQGGDSRVETPLLLFSPVMFIGIGYGLFAGAKWGEYYQKSHAPFRSWLFWLGFLLILPSVFNCCLLALYCLKQLPR
jgi:hypothetical protein